MSHSDRPSLISEEARQDAEQAALSALTRMEGGTENSRLVVSAAVAVAAAIEALTPHVADLITGIRRDERGVFAAILRMWAADVRGGEGEMPPFDNVSTALHWAAAQVAEWTPREPAEPA